MSKTLYASFKDRDQAVKAAGALLDHGVLNDDLSIISHGNEEDLRAFGGSAEAPAEDPDKAEATAKHGLSTTSAEDAGVGAAKGAGWGLGLGAAAAVAALFVPGVGIVVGGGALAAALAATALATGAGALAGGVHGYLVDQGVPADEAAHYTEIVEHGGAVIAVSLPSGEVTEPEAHDVLAKYQFIELNAYGTPALT